MFAASGVRSGSPSSWHGDRRRRRVATRACARQRVPFLVPRLSLWKDADVLEVRPPRIVMTFIDASLMLLAVPISELIEYLQERAILPVFFLLP